MPSSNSASPLSDNDQAKRQQELEHETGDVKLAVPYGTLFSATALLWALFQLWIASPLPFILDFAQIFDLEARAIHLSFAFTLCFLAFGYKNDTNPPNGRIPSKLDLLLIALSVSVTLYLVLNHTNIAQRAGMMAQFDLFGLVIPFEVIMGGIGIILLLEATRRAIGLPLVVMATLFLIYSVLGPYMPDIIAHKGVSISRLVGYHWFTSEAIFGIPIKVVTDFVFLFVLLGALLNRAGAGQYFIDLAFAAVGKYRGGPAKASVLASGLTGMISGSSIANTVTTGTFTIPVMKRTGMSAEKAGAIEVAASTDGQLMPPIMGAAAFVMAEFIGLSYSQVVVHAAIPALMSYLGLFYITHLEAIKHDLKPIPADEIKPFTSIFWQGAHYFLPILVLIYLLMVAKYTPSASVFWSIISLLPVILYQEMRHIGLAVSNIKAGIIGTYNVIIDGLIDSGKNMISVSIAVAAAGIIVGAVASTGLNNALIGVVETLANGNIYILLVLTAVLCLILGMGLPTTANYLVVASIMAPVLSQLGGEAGLVMPLIAVHLFVFYYGLMADTTPPVGLAAYAAAAISRGDPIKTGLQAFSYSMRTAILPFIFIFNLDLLLINVTNPLYAFYIFVIGVIAIMCFTSLTFRFMRTDLSWLEMAALALITAMLLRPGFFINQVSPQWITISHGISIPKNVESRFSIKRLSPLGEKIKIIQNDKNAFTDTMASYGLTVKKKTGEISNVKFMSKAEKAGFQYGDTIIKMEYLNKDQPNKNWIIALALLLLGFLVNNQSTKAGRPIDWQAKRQKVKRLHQKAQSFRGKSH